MICPKCGYEKSRVADSYMVNNTRRRIRVCKQCGFRYTTYEGYGDAAQVHIMQEVSRDLMRNIKYAIKETFADYQRGMGKE